MKQGKHALKFTQRVIMSFLNQIAESQLTFIFGVKTLKDLISHQKSLELDQEGGLVYPQNCEARIRAV